SNSVARGHSGRDRSGRLSRMRPYFRKETTMITRRHFSLTLGALAAEVARTGVVHAQSYPTKSVRVVVPFPAGGSTDVGARLIAEHMSRAFGQQVYVENKSGA